jgi:hypothetical protein
VADPRMSLDTEHFSAQPGGQVTASVTVTNPGTVVEGYQLQILGPLAPWAVVTPPDISVYPQQDAKATVVISVPTGTGAPSGLQPFGVLARSTLGGSNASATVEGDIEIGQIFNLQASISPGNSWGRWGGRHVIDISNWGNTQVPLQMKASDKDLRLAFYLRPEYLTLWPGQSAKVALWVGPRNRHLRGAPQSLPFQVVGERLDAAAEASPAAAMPYGDPSRPGAQATFNQKPVFSKGVIIFLSALLVVIIALVGGLVATRPAIKDEQLAARGAPPKPQLTATTAGPDSIALSWVPILQVEHYNLQWKVGNATGFQQPPGEQNTATVGNLPADTQACFQLSATANGLTGPLSEPACARTAPAPPSPSPTPSATPTPSPTPTPTTPSPSPSSTSPTPTASVTPGDPNTDPIMKQHWIAVAEMLPTPPKTELDAQQAVAKFKDAKFDAKVLNTVNYPKLLPRWSATPTPDIGDYFMIYVGPFDTQVDAANKCGEITSAAGVTPESCVAVQPDPP